MRSLRAWCLRFAGLFRKEQCDRELGEELESHLQMHIEDNLGSGMNPVEARRQALIKLGGVEQVKEKYRDRRDVLWLEQLVQDVRFGLRMLGKNPGFTAAAVITLALGIGANTAIFGLINTVMLRLLPVRDPGRLVELLQHYPGEPRGNGFWSWPAYEYYRDDNHVFAGLIAASPASNFSVRGEHLGTESVNGESVDGSFFSVLGVKPAIGRLIGPDDISNGAVAPVVGVLGWSYWKSRFDLDPKILGKSIIVQNQPVTVIGVTAPEFFGLQVGSRTDIWLPLVPSPSTRLTFMARLKPGVTIEQALAEMTVLYRFTIEERAKNNKDPLVQQLKVEIEPAGAGLSRLRDQFGKPLFVLMGIVGLVLLIACANVAGLLLARGAAREHEMAIRLSLGAGRFRLVRQVLTECLLLSAVGSLLGVVLAYFGAGALVRIITSGRQIIGFPQSPEISLKPDTHMLIFTTGVALLSGMLFGLAPAWNAFASEPAGSLRQMGISGGTKFRSLFGKSLVGMQVALSVVLLSAAGLFVRHLSKLQHVDLGFRRDHVLLVTLDPSRSEYNPAQLSQAYQVLLDRLERTPGVHAASLIAPIPLSGAGASAFATVEGQQERPEDSRHILIGYVAPKSFEALGIPLLAGREFNFQDQGAIRVGIINQAMARYYFPNGNPVGRHVTLDHVTGDSEVKSYEIVGVVGDSKYFEIREAANRTIYLPAFHDGIVGARSFVLRTNIDPHSVEGDVRVAVRDVLKTIPMTQVTTISDQVDASIVPERLIATLSGLFGALGAVLAAIGLYALLTYTVARRTHEIGIRMALGATSGDVTRMVIRDALVMVCAGLVVGIPIALWSENFTVSFTQDLPVKTAAPIAFGAVAMITVALLAAYLPARRAARVDPMEALRYE